MKRGRNKGGEEGSGDRVKKKPKLDKEGGQKKKGSRNRVENKPKLGGEGGEKKGRGDNPDDELEKKTRVALQPKKASVGHSLNINERHAKQFQSLLVLASAERYPLQVTNDVVDVLARPSSLNGLYLQWEKDVDRYFLWGSIASKEFVVKFELDGGFEASINLLDVKNPLLVFSESFDHNDSWIEVKQLLRELFGHPDGEGASGDHDYLYAFTRTGVMLHLRIFKLLSHLNPNMENMKLEEVSPSFLLKPLETHRLCEMEDGSSNYRKTIDFFDEDVFMFERKCCLSLGSCAVLYDNSSTILVPHIMKLSDLHRVMLPSPIKNAHWFGFNTSCKEFFERYHVFRKTHVPGTGPDPCPPNPSVSMKKKKKRKATTPLEAIEDPLLAAVEDIPTPSFSKEEKIDSSAPLEAIEDTHSPSVSKKKKKKKKKKRNPPAPLDAAAKPTSVAATVNSPTPLETTEKPPANTVNPPTPLEATGNPPDPLAATFDPTPVAATAVDYENITVPMKVFCRSLIEKVGEIFKMPACLSDDFTTDNIFLKGGKMAILGVKLVPYSKPQALKNCAAIYGIIQERLEDMTKTPEDVKAALRLLSGKDPIGNFDKILNNVCWMIAVERNHLVADLHDEFTEYLDADAQVRVTQKLDGMQTWEAKFKNNWLIYACRTYCLPPNALASEDGMVSYLKRKAHELQDKPDDPNLDVLTPENSGHKLDLYAGRSYFGSIRHLYVHLSDTARKQKKMKAMDDEEKDLVVSSEFAATLSSIQIHVPAEFEVFGSDSKASKRSSYARFKSYFKDVEFDSCDEKIEQQADLSGGATTEG
uniref:Uncharacterized protein n=1 Tax=Arundo donax TaxID=35708 RepID=A0A0A9GBI8_ARUDO